MAPPAFADIAKSSNDVGVALGYVQAWEANASLSY